jgi:hypothetical protein
LELLTIDLSYTQSIKQLRDNLSVCGSYELSVHPSVCAIRDSVDDIPAIHPVNRVLRAMCGSRTNGWLLLGVMSD